MLLKKLNTGRLHYLPVFSFLYGSVYLIQNFSSLGLASFHVMDYSINIDIVIQYKSPEMLVHTTEFEPTFSRREPEGSVWKSTPWKKRKFVQTDRAPTCHRRFKASLRDGMPGTLILNDIKN